MNNLRLITLDATGTIFRFREPPPRTYVKFAQANGINCNENDVLRHFKMAYKIMNTTHPHFGATSGITSHEWWSNVVFKTFEGIGPTQQEKSAIVKMSEDLYQFYNNSDAYEVYKDFLYFAEERCNQENVKWAVISNFDVRLHAILQKLNVSHNFSLIMTSEEAKNSKPSKEIFELTLEKLDLKLTPGEILHIGDDPKNDCPPQGWHRILLQRDKPSGRFKNVCQSFQDVSNLIENT